MAPRGRHRSINLPLPMFDVREICRRMRRQMELPSHRYPAPDRRQDGTCYTDSLAILSLSWDHAQHICLITILLRRHLGFTAQWLEVCTKYSGFYNRESSARRCPSASLQDNIELLAALKNGAIVGLVSFLILLGAPENRGTSPPEQLVDSAQLLLKCCVCCSSIDHVDVAPCSPARGRAIVGPGPRRCCNGQGHIHLY